MEETTIQSQLAREQAIDRQQQVGCHRCVLVKQNIRYRTNEWMPCPEPAAHYAVFHHPGDRIVESYQWSPMSNEAKTRLIMMLKTCHEQLQRTELMIRETFNVTPAR